jgi:hypothetical protein
MFPYWLLFLILAFGALLNSPRAHVTPDGDAVVQPTPRRDLTLLFAAILIVLMIGLRFSVGGDWRVYQANFERIGEHSLSWTIANSPNEPGYTLITWIVTQFGADIWLVNLICAIPFVAGLMALARQQPNPFLALTVAAPLLIIVVGMGYTRQAAALGFLLIAITSLTSGKSFWKFLLWNGTGGLFHFSVLFFVPLTALLLFRGKFLSFLLLIIIALIGYWFVLPHALDRYSIGYIRSVYEAQGAIFRISLSAISGLTLLIFGRRFFASLIESRIWLGWALLSLFSLLMLFFVRSTVIVDRLSVYLLPVQVFVFGRLPWVFGGRQSQLLWTLVVIAVYAVVLLLWLTFANHAKFWVPYRVFPFFS